MEGKAVFKGFHERNLALSMASAGMTAGLNASTLMSEFSATLNMGEHARDAFTSLCVNTSTSTIIGGQDLGESFLQSGVSAAGTYGMAKLVGATGDAFKAGKIEQVQRYTQHALSGFAVGAATNSVLGRDVLNGAFSGAIGAVSGELIADLHVKGAEGKLMTAAELSSFKQRTVLLSGVGAALTSSALHLDPSMAANFGGIAASENSLRVALGLAPHVIAAMEAAGYTLAAYNGVQDAKENGAASGAVTGATEAAFMFVGGKIIPVVVINAASSVYKSGVDCLRSVGVSVSRSFGAKSAGVLGKGGAAEVQATKPLLPGEGKVGTFKYLEQLGKRGDNLTPNHMPQDAYMKLYGVKRNEGISMWMEQPVPGVGGRHRLTRTYGRRPVLSANPRNELAADIFDARNIYKNDGVYNADIRESLQEVIKRNQQAFPDIFSKG